MELTEELIEKLANFFTHPLAKFLHPELENMTFDEFLNREYRQLQFRCKVIVAIK